MITMEFEEMKRIWDTQNNEPVYAINEKALHRRITAKKDGAIRTASFSELFLIVANIVAGGIIVASAIYEGKEDIVYYLLSGLMFFTAVFVLVGRSRRKKLQNQFDNTMLGELNNAIANATYQVRLSATMRWYLLPVALFTLYSVWDNDTAIWKFVLITVFFIIIFYASGKEHGFYVSRKKKLEAIRDNLEKEA